MPHLSSDQLLDVADGTRADREFPHLESCAVCVRQLADLRRTISAAREVEVPEPSPLFWDHLSTRIRTAVAATDPTARPFMWAGRAWWQWAAAAVAFGAIVLVISLGSPRVSVPGGTGAPAVASVDPLSVDDVRAFDDDPALALLADLSAGLDWEAATEAGLVPSEGTVDRVVFTLSAEERVELHRLLQEALGRAGA
jgi:hypothetical protein